MEYAASRISKSSLSQYRYTPHFVRSTLLYVSKSHDIDFKFIISLQCLKGGRGNPPPPGVGSFLRQERKSSSSSAKSSSGRDLPPSGSPSRIFCRLFSPQAIPLLPLELNA